jgi:hypothetical protein
LTSRVSRPVACPGCLSDKPSPRIYLDPEDRVAGLLGLLYAQWPSVISRLGHVHADDRQVRLSLGREHGIYSGQARSTALFQLTTDLPAAVLGRLLGIHITVAVTWQRASAGDWAAYAAEISRRKGTGNDTTT